MNQKEGPSTRSVHLCSRIDPATGAIVPPIIENAAFAYNTLHEWRAAALGQVSGYIYSRNTNPTKPLKGRKVPPVLPPVWQPSAPHYSHC